MTPEIANESTADVRVEVEDLARWRRRLALEVPAERVSSVRARSLQRFARKARVKGFRPGKVPLDLVQQRYASEIDREVLEELIREAFDAGVRQAEIEPISVPAIGDVHWSEQGALTFAAEVDVRPDIVLGRTTGFRVEEKLRRTTDADVDRVIERLRHERGTWRSVERPSAESDQVVFDSTPLDEDGAAIEDERVENHRIVLGSGSLLPDFEIGLGGVSAGETHDLVIGFPEDHPNEPLRGTSRTYRVDIGQVMELVLPDLDDAFAASVGAFETLDALGDQIRANLEQEITLRAQQGVNESLIDEIIDANEIDLPESMIDNYLTSMMNDEHGPVGGNVPADQEEEVRALLRPGAERAMRRYYILRHIAEAEELGASNEEFDVALAERAEAMETDVAELRKRLEGSGETDDLRFHLTMERVFDWLRERSEIRPVQVEDGPED